MAKKSRKTIEAKIANVISDDEVAVNIGATSGVAVGNSAVVPREIEIRDPDTKKVLGYVRRPLLRLEIAEVSENFCTARSVDRVDSAQYRGNYYASSILGGAVRTITTDPAEVDHSTVLVRPGDPVLVTVEGGD